MTCFLFLYQLCFCVCVYFYVAFYGMMYHIYFELFYIYLTVMRNFTSPWMQSSWVPAVATVQTLNETLIKITILYSLLSTYKSFCLHNFSQKKKKCLFYACLDDDSNQHHPTSFSKVDFLSNCWFSARKWSKFP